MKESVVPDKEFSVVTGPEASLPASSVSEQTTVPIRTLPSYQPYPWAFVNQVLDVVDAKTGGRAGWLQRLISYLFFGGTAGIVNLLLFYLLFYHVFDHMPNSFWHNTVSYAIAAECSIMANFIPNDRFTFNKLPGARRPWIQRCLRFQMTTIVGSILTYLIELTLSTFFHIEPVLAEAIATVMVLVYNFSFHHIFTYRRIKHS
jgi:putative flippase GtrA